MRDITIMTRIKLIKSACVWFIRFMWKYAIMRSTTAYYIQIHAFGKEPYGERIYLYDS